MYSTDQNKIYYRWQFIDGRSFEYKKNLLLRGLLLTLISCFFEGVLVLDLLDTLFGFIIKKP